MVDSKGKGRRRALLAAAVLVVAFGAWRSMALARYRTKGGALVARASAFPREYAVGEGRALRLLALGDSTAMGVGVDRYEDSLLYRIASGLGGRVAVRNLATSGATTRHLVREQLEKIPAEGADVVLVSISANDATKGTPPSDAEDALRTILDRLAGLGVRKVVLSTTPNFRTTPALPILLNRLFERRAADLTGTIRRLAAEYPFVRLADLNAEGTLTDEEYAGDGFHPNAAGYRLWASIFLRAAQ